MKQGPPPPPRADAPAPEHGFCRNTHFCMALPPMSAKQVPRPAVTLAQGPWHHPGSGTEKLPPHRPLFPALEAADRRSAQAGGSGGGGQPPGLAGSKCWKQAPTAPAGAAPGWGDGQCPRVRRAGTERASGQGPAEGGRAGVRPREGEGGTGCHPRRPPRAEGRWSGVSRPRCPPLRPALLQTAAPLAVRGRRPAARGNAVTGGSAEAAPLRRGLRRGGDARRLRDPPPPLRGVAERGPTVRDRHRAAAEAKAPGADRLLRLRAGGRWLEMARETEN